MISTGNDIVVLKAINIARTRQGNFYGKIISVSEKDLYDRQLAGRIPLENFVWLSWSIKESVYKYLQRITPELIFSPARIIISQILLPSDHRATGLEGRGFNDALVYKSAVTFGDHTLYSRSIISEEFIFSVVNHADHFEHTCWGIRLISSPEPAHQSEAARVFLTERLHTLFPADQLLISKSPHGYPVILKNGAQIPIPVSLAHHDHYVAYSFQLKD
ncbi:MAG: 4-phosphopantetheinyl transferase superfamily protein [Mucilaginibacter sp.]|nr:4-phosphopantetheinyl transferase superfamily protein [Mucilaginibacter sp.]